MLEASSKLTELENLLRRLPPAKRATLLKSIAEMFVEQNSRYRPAQIALFDRLFTQLIADAGKESAAALSRRISGLSKAPIGVVDRFAHDDDIAVAEPVLMRSPCIEDSTLAEIARTKSQTHLLAIACRTVLVQGVVELLVARGDEVVVRYVANNRGAQLSEAAVEALVERAKSDDTLALLIKNRGDIPVHLKELLPDNAPHTPPPAAEAAFV